MQTAFRLYDFDGNGYLTPPDIESLIQCIAVETRKSLLSSDKVTNHLQASEVTEIVERVMRDCDIDGNGRLSYAEFSKVLKRIPDFSERFRIYIQ